MVSNRGFEPALETYRLSRQTGVCGNLTNAFGSRDVIDRGQ